MALHEKFRSLSGEALQVRLHREYSQCEPSLEEIDALHKHRGFADAACFSKRRKRTKEPAASA